MIAVLTLIVALPLGLLFRNRLVGYLAYAVVFGHVYTFQTANLLVEWVNGSTGAFSSDGETWAYLAVTTTIYAAGFGLVALGQWLRRRRSAGNEVRLDHQPT